jgi:hypothetical protein
VGAGVYDCICSVILRQMRVIPMSVKGELQHPHPGQTEPVAQRGDVRRDQPQILGEERQTAQFSLRDLEEFGARSGHPLARLRRRGTGRHVPRGSENPEVVQAHNVHIMQRRAHTIDAPAVVGSANNSPVIDRIAPELPCGAEIVWRDTRDKAWPVLLDQQEQLRIGQHIARIAGDEKGQITDQAQAFAAGIIFDAFRLAEQQELRKADLVDLARQLLAGARQSRGITPDQLGRPSEVISVVMPEP